MSFLITTATALEQRVAETASGRGLHHGGRYAADVVDRAGGGDAFAAGLVHAILCGMPDADAIRFATAAGACKLGIPGDMSQARVRDVTVLMATHA